MSLSEGSHRVTPSNTTQPSPMTVANSSSSKAESRDHKTKSKPGVSWDGKTTKSSSSKEGRPSSHREEDSDIRLSKHLSKVLRHEAVAMGLSMASDGYVKIDDLLRLKQLSMYDVNDIIRVVENNKKQRFQLAYIPDDTISSIDASIEKESPIENHVIETSASSSDIRLRSDRTHMPTHIRAVQGHSIDIIETNELLSRIIDPADVPICIHGSYKRFLSSIMATGLNKMSRNHIHMATGLPYEVKSGARRDVNVLIYVDVTHAMSEGITFYQSRNGVILTAGVNDSGILPSKYFQRVVNYPSMTSYDG